MRHIENVYWIGKWKEKVCCLPRKGKCCCTRLWKEDNNMPVRQQLIWSTAANHWGPQHFTLIFCLSNNLLQNSSLTCNTWSFRAKIYFWLHHRCWLDTDDGRPDGSNHRQPGWTKNWRFSKRSLNFRLVRPIFSLPRSISNKLTPKECRRAFGLDYRYGLFTPAMEHAFWIQQMCRY